MPSARLAVAVALLAVLAGCGAGAPETATPVTPAPVPTDGGRTGVGGGFAPGVDETGIYDADALLDAHFEWLANTSYTVRLSTVRRYRNGSLQARHDRVLRVAEDDRFHYVLTVERRDGRDRRIDRWRADGEAYTAVTVGNNTTYQSLTRPETPQLVTRSELLRLFRFVPARRSDDRADGTTRYRVVGGPRDLPPLSNVSYAVLLTGAGHIRSYHVTYDTTRQGQPRQVMVNATFSGVGTTTVDPPPAAASEGDTPTASDRPRRDYRRDPGHHFNRRTIRP